MLSKQSDRILSLALENQELARIERTAIFLMAHIYQRKYNQNQIAALFQHKIEKHLSLISPRLWITNLHAIGQGR